MEPTLLPAPEMGLPGLKPVGSPTPPAQQLVSGQAQKREAMFAGATVRTHLSSAGSDSACV